MNRYWLDLAEASGRRPFVSPHVAEASRHVNEMLLAIALLDLPFRAGEHEISRTESGGATLRAASPLLVVRRELESADPSDDAPILVRQNYFELDDRYRYENGERVDRYVTGEMLAGEVYGCQVVLTNPSSSPRKLELLLQIPGGAIPVKGGFTTRSESVRLNAFSTTTREYHFYFPRAGAFRHFPVHVSLEDALIGHAEPVSLDVVTEPTVIDTTSWGHVSQNASVDEVIAYLTDANLLRTDLEKIAWRMREANVFSRVLSLLRDRRAYTDVLWSYAILHRDRGAIREYLEHKNAIANRCGMVLDAPILSVDPVERGWIEHLEYKPLFHSRAHAFGGQRRIGNDVISAQYQRFLQTLVYRPAPRSEDWLRAAYYFLLQDRIEEGRDAFAKGGEALPEESVQTAYLRAYLDFFDEEDPAEARGVVAMHRDHPVAHWREKIRGVESILAELAGESSGDEGADGDDPSQESLANSEPSIDFDVVGESIRIRARNLEEAEIRYYPMDVEHLFSIQPFVEQSDDGLAFIRPRRVDTVSLSASEGATVVELPAEFQSSNLLIEVRGGGIARSRAHSSHALDIRWMENFGQLEVRRASDGKPLPRTYVKVFARMSNGSARFYKDGYTDLRGRFDYVSLSNDELSGADRFSVLVLSPADGAVIEEVRPPKR